MTWHPYRRDAANVEAARRFFAQNRDTRLFPPVIRNVTVTSENVNAAVAGYDGDIDLLSLDIDSIDYWVLSELSAVRPRVMVVEAPTIWGPTYARTLPNDPRWTHAANPDFYGASLGAFDRLLCERGCRFVGSSKYGTNPVFLRDGVGEDPFPAVPLEDGFRHPRAPQDIEVRSERSKHLPWVDV